MPLPPGLSLNRSTGAISGTPTEAGVFTETLVVRDSAGAVRSIPIEITIAAYTAVTLSGTMAQYANRTVAYSSGFTRNDGIATFTWSLLSGTLPTGLRLNTSTGVVSGTPTSTSYGSYPITIKVVDGAGGEDTADHTLLYQNVLSLSGNFASAVVSSLYSSSITRSGGHSPFTYSIQSGTIPAGTSLNTSTGVISGTPTTIANYSFTLRVVDAAGTIVDSAESINVASSYVPVSLSGGLSGTTNNYANPNAVNFSPTNTLVASGGSGMITYSWARIAGSTNISAVSATSLVTDFQCDVPDNTSENATFRLTATDGTSSATYDAVITGNNTYIAPSTSGDLTLRATRTVAYSSDLNVSNGVDPTTWTLQSGTLPTGLSLTAATGTVSGTPTDTTYTNRSLTFRATDSFGLYDEESETIQYRDFPTMPSPAPGYATRTVAYSVSWAASNEADCHASVAYSLSSGALPTGLSLNSSTGLVSGTPTSTSYGNQSFTVRVTDAAGNTADRAVTLPYQDVLALAGSLASAYIGDGYFDSLSRTGGHSAFTYDISVGSLPAGLTINSTTGLISGTPTTAATTNFTVRVTDAAGATATHATSITVSNPISVTDQSLDHEEIATNAFITYRLNSNGKAQVLYGTSYPGGTSYDIASEWLLSGSSSNYQVKATLVSGSLASGSSPTGSLLDLSTTRDWGVSRLTNGTNTAEILVEIFHDSDLVTPYDSATIGLSATRSAA